MKRSKLIYLFLIIALSFSTNAYSQVTKENSVFDKVIVNPDTAKVRIASLTIDIVNQQVIVVFQTGNEVAGEFVVEGQTAISFITEEGKEDFNDVLTAMKFDLTTFIAFVKDRI